jgi:hypothetical protein
MFCAGAQNSWSGALPPIPRGSRRLAPRGEWRRRHCRDSARPLRAVARESQRGDRATARRDKRVPKEAKRSRTQLGPLWRIWPPSQDLALFVVFAARSHARCS